MKYHYNLKQFSKKIKQKPFLLFGSTFILLAVIVLYISGPYLSSIQQRKLTTGFSFEMAKEFAFF